MNKIELLSPVGDWDCLLAAVQNGADSVYFGSTLFNARASANNFDVPTLKKAIQYCKLRNVRTFLTLNILIKNSEFNDAINLAQKAYEFGVDALIVQDLGLARYLIKNFPDMPIHGSTQMSIHNLEGVLELQDLGFKRVVLARELPLNEIQYICKNSKIEILQTVEDKTREIQEFLSKNIETLYEENEGNHFKDGVLRMAKGIKWILE